MKSLAADKCPNKQALEYRLQPGFTVVERKAKLKLVL